MWWFNKKIQHLPLVNGPYQPGCMDVMVGYGKEGIFSRFYYPTNAKKDNPDNIKRWIPWIPDDTYVKGIASVLMSFTIFIRLAIWWSGGVTLIPAIYGARIKLTEKLKCIILSHGLGGSRFLYSNICCELASYGFLVASIEHREHSACNTYYYQSREDAINKIRTPIEFKTIELGKKHFEKRHEQVKYRANECCKILDILININNGNVAHNIINEVPTTKQINFSLHDLIGKLDLHSITMAGHSFGGATALLTLSKRDELKQGILLDPWMFSIKEENLHTKVKQPLLFINTQTFHIATNVNSMEKFLTNDYRKMYTILHTTHENQTDTPLLIGYWLNWFMKKLDPIDAIKINNSLILQFLYQIIGFPSDIKNCQNFLEEQKINIDVGLTKPWA